MYLNWPGQNCKQGLLTTEEGKNPLCKSCCEILTPDKSFVASHTHVQTSTEKGGVSGKNA